MVTLVGKYACLWCIISRHYVIYWCLQQNVWSLLTCRCAQHSSFCFVIHIWLRRRLYFSCKVMCDFYDAKLYKSYLERNLIVCVYQISWTQVLLFNNDYSSLMLYGTRAAVGNVIRLTGFALFSLCGFYYFWYWYLNIWWQVVIFLE